MQTLHKIWLIALVGLLVLALAGCAPGTQTPDAASPQRTLRIITSTPQNTRTPTVTPTPLVPVLGEIDLAGIELDFWYLWSPAEPDSLADIVDWFNAENEYGIKITPRAFFHPDDYETALEAALAASAPPDIILADPYQYQPWAAAGLLVNLTPYLENDSYGGSAWMEKFYPVFSERDVYEGARWGVPGLFTGQVMLYNRTWAQALGFSNPPANSAAFQEQACAAADANGGITGGWMIDGTQGGAAAWLLAYAGSLDKSGQYRFEAEEVEDALAFLAGISKEGCAWQPAEPYPDQAFIDRLGLFYPVSTHEIPFVAAAFEDSASTDVWTAIGYPNNQGSSVISVHGQSYVVARSTIPQQVAAWLAIQTLTGERSQAYLAQNHAYLPLDSNAAQRIKAENSLPPQWYQAAGLLEQAAVEPRLASWRIVRSIVQDAVAQVLDVRFEPGTLSLLVRQLAETAAEYNQ